MFPAQTGATNAYIGANFNNGAGIATDQQLAADSAGHARERRHARLLDPDDPTGVDVFPDRLQVRMSTAGAGSDVGTTATDVGTFTILLLDINPTYAPTGLSQRLDAVHRDRDRRGLAHPRPPGLPVLRRERRPERH